MFDSEANPLLSLHLQARHSFDESSTDLETGVHNSWRISSLSKRIHGASLFTIDEEEGTIEVPVGGLYFIYAQVCMVLCCIVNDYGIGVFNVTAWENVEMWGCSYFQIKADKNVENHRLVHLNNVLQNYLKRMRLFWVIPYRGWPFIFIRMNVLSWEFVDYLHYDSDNLPLGIEKRLQN